MTTKHFETMTKSAPGRFDGISRDYTISQAQKLAGSVQIEHTLARRGADKLWELLTQGDYVHALGAVTGNQAMQMVRAGLKAIYLSGWQVAADANTAGSMYPDQSIYPVNSGPDLATRINNALLRADQIQHQEQSGSTDWLVPIVADAEAGFGGPLNAYELTRSYIKAGAAAVHFEDQLASEKKCGHMGGKVLIPTQQHIANLNAARLAADSSGVPTLIVARTDAESAQMITTDIDERDKPFLTGERTQEGFYRFDPETAFERCAARGLAYAEYADMLWMETSKPDLAQARRFAQAIHAKFPGKLLAYNCSPSFNWSANLGQEEIATFQRELASMGYKFQFVTLAGFHALNHSMYTLAQGYRDRGMAAYCELQDREFADEANGYTATKHQREVGTGWFDAISTAVRGGTSSTTALTGSTEEAQFASEGKQAQAAQ